MKTRCSYQGGGKEFWVPPSEGIAGWELGIWGPKWVQIVGNWEFGVQNGSKSYGIGNWESHGNFMKNHLFHRENAGMGLTYVNKRCTNNLSSIAV